MRPWRSRRQQMNEPFARPSPSRVERSFAFVDLSGFTRYTENRGDREAVAILADFRNVLRSVAAAHGVLIAKWLGDGAMLVGVESEPLMEAVVHSEQIILNRLPLRLRAGMAAGDVILFEGDDHIGHTVNLAAQLCRLSDPGQLLAPAEMVSSLMVNLSFAPLGKLQVPGFERPVEVINLSSENADVDVREYEAARVSGA